MAVSPLAPPHSPERHPKDRDIKQWWLRRQIFEAQLHSPKERSKKVAEGDKLGNGRDRDTGAIVPIDLSVNHLQLIERAGGSPNAYGENAPSVAEEFLPVVTSSDVAFGCIVIGDAESVVPQRVEPSQGRKNRTRPSRVLGTIRPIFAGEKWSGSTT